MGSLYSCCENQNKNKKRDSHDDKSLKIIKTLQINLKKDYYIVKFHISDGREAKIECRSVDDFLEKLPKQ